MLARIGVRCPTAIMAIGMIIAIPAVGIAVTRPMVQDNAIRNTVVDNPVACIYGKMAETAPEDATM